MSVRNVVKVSFNGEDYRVVKDETYKIKRHDKQNKCQSTLCDDEHVSADASASLVVKEQEQEQHIAEIKATIETFDERIRKINECVENTTNTVNRKQTEFDNILVGLKTDNELLKNNNGQFQAVIDLLKNNNEIFKNDNELLRANSESMKTDIGLLKENDEKCKNDIELLIASNENMKTDIGLLKESDESMKTDIGLLKENDEKCKNDIELLRASNESMKTDIGLLKAENEELKTKLTAMQEFISNINLDAMQKLFDIDYNKMATDVCDGYKTMFDNKLSEFCDKQTELISANKCSCRNSNGNPAYNPTSYTSSAFDGQIVELIDGKLLPVSQSNYKGVFGICNGKAQIYSKECKILVLNKSGNALAKGDLISSYFKGYGMKQTDDVIKSYSIAKSNETVDFTKITTTIDLDGIIYKYKLVNGILI